MSEQEISLANLYSTVHLYQRVEVQGSRMTVYGWSVARDYRNGEELSRTEPEPLSTLECWTEDAARSYARMYPCNREPR